MDNIEDNIEKAQLNVEQGTFHLGAVSRSSLNNVACASCSVVCH